MPENAYRLDRVPEALWSPIREYCDLLNRLGRENVQALTLFGAVAAGSFDATRHTVRNVLIVDTVDLDMLRRLAGHGANLGKQRLSAPLIMTKSYIEASLDAFPLELIEIHQNHVTVLGQDAFADLKFDDAHVRLQCEREFKTILIGLRQGLLAAVGKDKMIEAVMTDASEELVRTLRGLLWLKGQRDGKPADDVVAAVENITQRHLPGVRAALDVSAAHGWSTFQALYADVESLAEVANA